jgi:hypothetical protein
MLRSSRLKQINFEIIDRRYLHWVFQAKKRLGLSVLNYTVTVNHIHVLVKHTGFNGSVTQAEIWSRPLSHATRFRRGRTVSCIPIARRTALKLFSSGFPFGDNVR